MSSCSNSFLIKCKPFSYPISTTQKAYQRLLVVLKNKVWKREDLYMQSSYLLKSENHRDSSFSFIQGVATSKKQRLYFLPLYHKRLVVKRFSRDILSKSSNNFLTFKLLLKQTKSPANYACRGLMCYSCTSFWRPCLGLERAWTIFSSRSLLRIVDHFCGLDDGCF